MSDLPPPNQPYRVAALFHAALAAVILLVAAVSGADATKAIVMDYSQGQNLALYDLAKKQRRLLTTLD